MSKHTPAPWNNLPRTECIPLCRQDEAGLSIGFVHSSDPARQAEGLANAFLITAAPDLFESQTMGAQMNTPDFLDWMADRLIHVYGESPDVDFVLSLRSRANAGRKAIAKARGES